MAFSLGGNKSKSKQSSSQNQSFDQTSSTSMGGYGKGILTDRMGELGGKAYEGLQVGDIEQWMNPQTQAVIDATTADIEAARGRAGNEQRQAMLARGALGGSDRRGVYEAELDGQYDRTLATTLGGLRSNAWDKAAGIAGGETANRNNYDQGVQQQINQLLALLAGSDTVTRSSGTSSGTSKGSGTSYGVNAGFKYGG